MRSVANLTRKDGEEFLQFARQITIETQVTPFDLTAVNQALLALRSGQVQGLAVLVVD